MSSLQSFLFFYLMLRKKKHLSVFHADYKGGAKKIWKMEHRCLFIIKDKQGSNRCNLLFKSANQLLEHRQKAKHILQRKKKSGESTSSGKKDKRWMLEQPTCLRRRKSTIRTVMSQAKLVQRVTRIRLCKMFSEKLTVEKLKRKLLAVYAICTIRSMKTS